MSSLFVASVVQAHDPGLSASELRIQKGELTAEVAFSMTDAVRVESGHLLEIRADGQTIAPDTRERLVEDSDIRFKFTYSLPQAATLTVRSVAFDRLPSAHRQYLTIRDDANRLVLEQVLDVQAGEIEIPRSASHPQHTCGAFLAVGIVHILTGYDHLLFLGGLLLVGGRLRSVAKIITSFTVAHSITLGAATFDLVRLSSRLVEPLIAATIVFVGIENLVRRGEVDRRWVLTFVFGLVHGLGFASALKELGIGAGAEAAVPLLSFNLGVEVGQLAVAIVVLPAIWRLSARPLFAKRFVPACSVAVALVGTYWLVERAFLR
jgi:hydrogenase/urease accessory protein HupE